MFDIINSDIHILWLYNIMDRIYKYNPDISYEPVAEHDDDHSNSFQVKFPNVFTSYLLGAVTVKD